jgi:hypothetical protein
MVQTAHEQRQEQEERDRQWTKRAREVRLDAMRACPAGRALDRAHVVALMGQSPSSNKPFLMWRRFAIRGMRADGYTGEQIRAALGLDDDAAALPAAPGLWWDPPAGMLDDLPEPYRALVVGAR